MENGIFLQGFPCGANKVIGVSTLDQLENAGLLRPSKTEKAKGDAKIQEQMTRELHAKVQRTFDRQRIKRAGEDYADYILAVDVNGKDGGTPPIILFFYGTPEVMKDGVVIPYRQPLVAIDGETQTEARYILRDGCTGKINNIKIHPREPLPQSGSIPVAYVLYHSCSIEHAQQVLHDFNTYGVRISEKDTASFNNEGPISRAVYEAARRVGVSDNIKKFGRKADKKTIAAFIQAGMFVAGYQVNGTAKGPIKQTQFQQLNSHIANAVPEEGVNALASVFNNATVNRQIGSAPTDLWQVAGQLTRQFPAEKINWSLAQGQRNAARLRKDLTPEQRLQLIAQAMQQP